MQNDLKRIDLQNRFSKLPTFLQKNIIFPGAIRKIHAEVCAWFAFSVSSRAPIIIYQMGKVGSSTVYRSLKSSVLKCPVLQLHFLSDDLPRHQETHRKAGIYPFPYHIYLSMATRRALSQYAGNSVKVITLVREPISFAVSNYFQNPRFLKDTVKTKAGEIEAGKLLLSLEEMLSESRAFEYLNTWFDRELKSVFKIDVFSEPFDHKKGYGVFAKGQTEALLIRLEDLSRVGPASIASFLGSDRPLTMKTDNIRSQGKEGDKYRWVKKNIKLSKTLCEKIYAGKFSRHFYSEKMIEQFINKWTSEGV